MGVALRLLKEGPKHLLEVTNQYIERALVQELETLKKVPNTVRFTNEREVILAVAANLIVILRIDILKEVIKKKGRERSYVTCRVPDPENEIIIQILTKNHTNLEKNDLKTFPIIAVAPENGVDGDK